MRILFALLCTLLSAGYLYLSFVAAPPELWTPTELVVGSALYGPFFLAAISGLLFRPNVKKTLPWGTLGFLLMSSAFMATLGYNMAGGLVGIVNLVFAWVLLIKTMRAHAAPLDPE